MEKNKYKLNQKVYGLFLYKDKMNCPICDGKVYIKINVKNIEKECECPAYNAHSGDMRLGKVMLEQYVIESGKIKKITSYKEKYLDKNKLKHFEKISYYIENDSEIEENLVFEDYESAKKKMIELNKEIINNFIKNAC